MSGHSSSNEINELKVKIKKWEKSFQKIEGRKAEKADIDRNNEIRSAYKRYWFLVKSQIRPKETKRQHEKRKKEPLRELSAKKYSLNQQANKLLKHFVNGNIDTKSSYSLKRKAKRKVIEEEVANKENVVIDVKFPDFDDTAIIKDSLNDQINQIVGDTNLWSLPEEEAVVVTEVYPVDETEVSEIVEEVVHEVEAEIVSEATSATNAVDKDSFEKINITKEAPETVSSLFHAITSRSSTEKDSDYCTFESSGVETSFNFDVYEFHDDKENDIGEANNRKTSTTKGKRKRSKSESKSTVKKAKLISKEEMNESEGEIKPKVKKRKSAPKENYQRLNMKKKVFASRGYKKFNSKRYKYSKWKKLKRNRCFKCGEADHWANDCPLKEVIDEMNNEELFHKTHETQVGDEMTPVFIPAKPLLNDSSQCDEMINDALYALGFKSFKKNQQETIKRILCGQSTIFVSPTGSGKSLCYQLPAYLYWKHKKCITLVVSPLISLMEDQLSSLPKCLKAVSIHSGLKPAEKQAKLSLAQQGNAQIIFLSPEMVVSNNYLDFSLLPSIAFVCIDEAHCLSEWSNNFRPSYLQLYKIMKEKFKVETFLALTATATKETTTQIMKNLELNIDCVIGETTVPKNLNLTVSHDVDKDYALIELLKSDRFINKKSIIIYCTRREITEKIATFIRIEMQNITFETSSGKVKKYDARAYHAGLMSDERLRIQKRFLKGDLRVVVATIAFGMGINKSDVEAVIHYNLPRSFESYVQEIGRAGRNGSQADCHVFLDSNGSDLYELRKHVYSNSVDKRSLRKLLEKVFKQCKCNVFNAVDADGSKTRCEGHEVAFPIKETVLELDMTEETILTLLCFLQLNFTKFSIEILPQINSVCKILCYKEGGKQMDFVAKRCPPLSVALTLHKKENKILETPSMFTFPFIGVASMLGQSSSAVRRQLKQCEWETGPNERMCRTNVRVQFNDLSFHLKAPGDLSDSEFEEVLEFLHKYVTSQENKENSKLINVYETFRKFSEPKVCKSMDSMKSERLKEVVNKYFSNEDKHDNDNTLTDSQLERWLRSSNPRSAIESLLEVDNCDIENARCDVKDLITIHSDQQFTARSIARILQGIGSPKYPVDVWGKVRRFWRTYIHMDFNTLMKVANEELIRLKTTF